MNRSSCANLNNAGMEAPDIKRLNEFEKEIQRLK
jgi:hypothetical protein